MLHSSHRTGAFLAAAVLTLAACDAPAPVELPARPISGTAQSRGTIFETGFDRYTAKVVVTMTGGGIAKLPPMAERRMEYDIERRLDDGGWTTTYDFAAAREAGRMRRMPIRKVVQGPEGIRYLDHNGNVIPLGSRRPPTREGMEFPDLTSPKPTPGAAKSADAPGWVGSIVSTRAEGEKRREQLAARFESGPGKGRTMRYRSQRDGLQTEIVLDTSRGTVEEIRTVQRGRVTALTRFEYQDIGEDRWLRVRSVQRREDPAGTRHPLTVEHRFEDQRFLRTEGR